jgi:hypothetical protein
VNGHAVQGYTNQPWSFQIALRVRVLLGAVGDVDEAAVEEPLLRPRLG